MALRAGRRARGRPRKFLQGLVAELIAAAEHTWRLDRKRDDGASEREHLASAQRQIANLPGWKGRALAEIVPEGPPFPDDLDYLWELFCEHAMGLAQTGMGPAVVTWQGLDAWCRQMRLALEPWEARAIVALGAVRAGIQAERHEAELRKAQKK